MKLRVVLFCLLGGLPLSIAALGAGNFIWWWLAGMLLAAAFAPFMLFGPRGFLGKLGIIAPVLLVVSVVCTWSEALIFLPGSMKNPAADLVGGLVLYLIEAVGLAAIAAMLGLGRATTGRVPHRPLVTSLLMVLTCGVAYALYYLVFGWITYAWFTKPYYPEATEIALRFGVWLYVIQFARGVLMTFAVLPAIQTLRLGRTQAAIAVGALMWIAGGAAQLLVPSDVMVTAQRMIHIVEILTQNVALGVTAVLWLRPRSAPSAAALARAA